MERLSLPLMGTSSNLYSKEDERRLRNRDRSTWKCKCGIRNYDKNTILEEKNWRLFILVDRIGQE